MGLSRRRIDDLVEVEVIKLGTQKPARVQVRFVDGRFEGRQEWVPPARLKVLWSTVEAFRHREALWDRIDELAIGDDPDYWAADEVFRALIDECVGRLEYCEAGACRVTDSDQLAELTGLDPQLWLACPDAFREGPDLVVPWPITEQLVQAAAGSNPSPVLEVVEQEEAEARRDVIHGRHYAGRGSRPGYEISPETCAPRLTTSTASRSGRSCAGGAELGRLIVSTNWRRCGSRFIGSGWWLRRRSANCGLPGRHFFG